MSSRCFSNTMLALNTVNSSVLSARRLSAELLKQSYHMQFVINSSRLSCEHQPDEFSVHPVCPWNRPSVHHYTDDMMLHPLTSVQLFVASLLQSFNHICSFASWLRWRVLTGDVLILSPRLRVCVCVVFQWRRSSRWPGCSSRSRGSCWWPCPGWTSWATSWRRWGATGWSILFLLLITTAPPPRLSWSASTRSCRWDDQTSNMVLFRLTWCLQCEVKLEPDIHTLFMM